MQIMVDTRTVILTSFAWNFLLVLILTIYQKNKRTERHTKLFTWAKLFQALAFGIWGLNAIIQTQVYNFWSLFAGSAILLIAMFFESLAVMQLTDTVRKWTVKAYGIGIAVFAALYVIAYYMGTSQSFRIILFSVFTSVLIFYPLLQLMKWKKEYTMQRLAGFIYLLMLVFFIARGLVESSIIPLDSALHNQIQSWILFALFVLMILANAGYLFLSKVREDIKLIQLANYDELTNILNRRAFNDFSERAIQYCARKNEPVSFMIFDIDGFKKVNDTFGHIVGDTVLMEIASMVQSQIRAYDFFGRYGGDEFALLLPAEPIEDAERVAHRLLKSVALRGIYKHTKVRVTISIGLISVVPTSDTSMETLYQLADGALYDAKLAGGNCIMQPVQTIRAGGMNGDTG